MHRRNGKLPTQQDSGNGAYICTLIYGKSPRTKVGLILGTVSGKYGYVLVGTSARTNSSSLRTNNSPSRTKVGPILVRVGLKPD